MGLVDNFLRIRAGAWVPGQGTDRIHSAADGSGDEMAGSNIGTRGKRFAFVRGIALTLAIISLWAVPAYVQTHGEFLRIGIGRHVIAGAFGAMEGHGGSSLLIYLLLIPFYFVTIFASFFPWSIKLPWLINQARRSRDRIDSYLLGGSALVFLVFTLVSTKLPHYTLTAFPLLARSFWRAS